MFQSINDYFFLLLISVILSITLGIYLGRSRRRIPGSKAMITQFIAIGIWCLGYGFELVSQTLAAKVFWAKFEYIGIAIVPVAWFLFILEYSGNKDALKRPLRRLLWLEPAIVMLLAWTNELHGLVWEKVWLGQSSGALLLFIDHGPWFWVHITYAYALLFASSVLTFSLIKRYNFKGPESFALFASALVPWLGNGAYILGISPIRGLDLTPFAFAVSGVVMAWGVIHLRILEISPMAHEIAISNMTELMFVTDENGSVIDANPSAQEAFNLPASFKKKIYLSDILGREYGQGSHPVTHDGEISPPAIVFHNDREYEMLRSPLVNPRKEQIGQLVLLHDVTHHRQIERRLQLQFDVSRTLVGVTELNEAAQSILKIICTNIGFAWGGLWEVESVSEQLFLQQQWFASPANSFPESAPSIDGIKPCEGILGTVWQNQDTQWLSLDDYDADCVICDFALTHGWKVGLVVPIIFVGNTLGVMAFFSSDHPQQSDLDGLFNSVGSQIGQFLERQKTEKALHESEKKYKTFTDQLPVGVYRSKEDGTFLHLNQALANILGYASPEYIIQNVNAFDLYENPQDRFNLTNRWKKEGLTSSAVIPFHNRAGQRLWLRNTGRVTLKADGEIDYVDGVIEDVTEQKNAEDNLRESEQRYKELFHASLAQARELGLIIEVRSSLARELELEAVFNTIVNAVANVYGYKSVCLYFLKGDRLELQSEVGVSHKPEVHPTDTGVVGKVFRSGQPFIAPMSPEYAATLSAIPGVVSEIAVPLLDRGQIIGVLDVESDENKPLAEDDLRIFNRSKPTCFYGYRKRDNLFRSQR